jgi:hypothetical protein
VAIKSPANQRHVVFNDAATLPLNRLCAERVLVLAAIPIRELPRSASGRRRRSIRDIFSDGLLTKVGVDIIDHGPAAAASVRLQQFVQSIP